jgi:AraC-like DNA-binding protein
LPGRLTIKGGFTVDDARRRDLQQQARRLGFADLRACLQALLDDGWSIPQLATHLGTTQAAIRRAITDHHIPQPPRRQQLARQRQRAARQRAATRVAELGFNGVRAYLVDRLAAQAWTLEEVAAELHAAPSTLRCLLDQHGVRRVAPTRRQHAAAASGPTTQARAVSSAARPAWPSSGSRGWRTTYRTGTWGRAGRCGECAPNLASATAGCDSS